MITISKTIDISLLDVFFNNPKMLYDRGDTEFKYNLEHTYYTIYNNDDLIGINVCREITKISLEMHLYIQHIYRTSKLVNEVSDMIKKDLKQNTKYLNILAYTPESCEHVVKYLTRTGFTPVGYIPESVIYHSKLQGLIYFQHKLVNEV